MTKRVLILDDDEIELVLGWYHSAFGGDIAREPDEEDEELATRLERSRL